MTLLLQIFLWLSLTTIVVQCQSLKGANMIVTTVLDTPYTMLRETPQSNMTRNDRYEGYVVDLVDTISKILNFSYLLRVSEAGAYGSLVQPGKWNGIIGDVMDGRAHIGAGAISITADRYTIHITPIEHTHYQIKKINILRKKLKDTKEEEKNIKEHNRSQRKLLQNVGSGTKLGHFASIYYPITGNVALFSG